MRTSEEENHRKIAQTCKNFLNKMLGNEYGKALTIGTNGAIVDDLT